MSLDEMLDKTTAPRQIAVDAYERIYAEAGQLRETDSFYDDLLTLLQTAHASTGDLPTRRALLDVACGEGHMVARAWQQGIAGHGVDFSANAIATARRGVGHDRFAISDGEQLPFASHSFDYVTNIGSLEHFLHPEQGLAEMRRVAKPTGLLCLVLPNSYYLLDILWHVWRRGYPVSHKQTIERFATAGQWRDFLAANGLTVMAIHKYNLTLPRTWADWRWYARWPQKLLYPLTSPITPFNLSYHFLFLCRPG